MNTVELNIARKWRPQSFKEVVGQDLSIRMLQNSLYAKKLFPVYVFSGQRGCGKTSTARVFAAALNCHKLPDFQKDPASTALPCGACSSCTAMLGNNHPDFVEIDAASHTGVDHVRTLIESSAHLPLSGARKVYLIDEAHMLSRAAFNAFLKVLEEPPAGVHFILATTELEKLPDTVRSRAFQVFFGPVENIALHGLLKKICAGENIEATDEAIAFICAEADYSARDAINLLERVRFMGVEITQEAVEKTLGKMGDQATITLLSAILAQDPTALLTHLQENNFNALSPHAVWEMLVSLLRALLWHKFSATDANASFSTLQDELKALSEKCSQNRLHAMLQLLFTQEAIFLKTPKKHLFLELLLLQLCQQVNVADLEAILAAVPAIEVTAAPAQVAQAVAAPTQPSPAQAPVASSKQVAAPRAQAAPAIASATVGWDAFIAGVKALDDPLLSTICAQATLVKTDKDTKVATIALQGLNSFFETAVQDKAKILTPILEKTLDGCRSIALVAATTAQAVQKQKPKAAPVTQPVPPRQPQPTSQPRQPGARGYPQRGRTQSKRPVARTRIDVSDSAKWPTATLVGSYFEGPVELISDLSKQQKKS